MNQSHTPSIVNPQAMSTQRDWELRLSQFLLEQSPVPVVAIDAAGRIWYANRATANLLGFSRERLQTMSIIDIAPHRRADMWESSFQTLRKMGSRTLSSDWRAADGRTIAVELEATYLAYEAEQYVVVYAHDISERLASQAQAFRVAHFDGVTGLPNQKILQDRLQREAHQAIQDGRNIGVMVVEVNEIREINESLGQAFGDQLLMTLARRLLSGVRGSDTLAHMNAGKFVFLLTHESDAVADVVLQMSRLVLSALYSPIKLDQHEVMVSCSIGISIFPRDTEESAHVLQQAQAAMRMAQAQGKNQICFYTPQANAQINERLAREAALRCALDQDELYLQYQPQVDLVTGKVIGIEALVRWRNAVLGEVSPDDFIPIAEDTGLIFSIGAWVLKTACATAARWRDEGLPSLPMAINLSPSELRLPDIARTIESILQQTGFDPHCLTIEVTERMLMDNLAHVARTLNELKSFGITIALDDFGTGYSSLSSLRNLPIDVIKIGRSLVPDVTAATQDVSITRAIINMAHSLQIKVLAVGVENDGELALLVANGCDQMQGFYFSEPLHESEIVALLKNGKCLAPDLLGRKHRQRTLLLVDDEDSIVSSIKRLLRRDGYNIVTANNGVQGLQCLAEHDVDVIISDQRMPGMTGVEFLRRAKELYPRTVRMVLSGYTELQSITDAINEGAIYKFLTKPWDDERLRAHIQEAFHQKEMVDENRRLGGEVQLANRELDKANAELQRLLSSQREKSHQEEASLIIARQVLENTPVPVIGFDVEGMVVFMNPDAEKVFEGGASILGRSVDEVPVAGLAKLWHERDGLYHDIKVNGHLLRAVCRSMTGDALSQGSLMVLTPRHAGIQCQDRTHGIRD